MLLVTRQAGGAFGARFLCPVQLVPCTGAQDSPAGRALAVAIRSGNWRKVGSLHRNDQPDESCCCAGCRHSPELPLGHLRITGTGDEEHQHRATRQEEDYLHIPLVLHRPSDPSLTRVVVEPSLWIKRFSLSRAATVRASSQRSLP